MADKIARKDFFNNEKSDLSNAIDKKREADVLLIVGSMYVYLVTHGEMPVKDEVFERILLDKIDLNQLNEHFLWQTFMRLNEIVIQLRRWGEIQSAETIEKILLKIDYAKLADFSFSMAGGILGIALFGADINLAKPIIELGKTDTKYRDALGEVKMWLINSFPYLSGVYRETGRRLLNELDDIPIPDQKSIV